MKNINKHLLTLFTGSVFAILLVLFNSCKKEEPIKIECNCYEYHEAKEVNQQMQLVWTFDYKTNSLPDLCAKDNGQWVYSGSNSQYRYKVVCN